MNNIKNNTITMKTFLCFLSGILMMGCAISSHAQDRVILTIAGDGIADSTGDGGPATAARFNTPIDIAFDKTGNLYIADGLNNRIRKIDHSTGIITTIAGNGTVGYSGDTGPATNAQLASPHAVVIDTASNVYICDNGNEVIRKINTAGIITTIAGNGDIPGGYNGDGIAATSAELFNPFHISLDSAGNVYIADVNNHRIRKVTPDGIISTFAGNGVFTYGGDGGPATDASLGLPKGVFVGPDNTIYIGDQDYGRLRAVDPAGIIHTIAGTGTPGYGGDGVPATDAQLQFPISICVDYLGNIYFPDYYNNDVRMITPAGIIRTIAGNQIYGYNGDGGLATATQLAYPGAVAVDTFGIVYISDQGNNRIRILDFPPVFTAGHTQHIDVCKDSIQAIDSILSVIDSNGRQAETWSLVAAPLHGSAIASYSTTATGGVLVPAGLTYTPVTGYTGNDTFMVRVTDGYVSDTTAVYVTVAQCHPVAVANVQNTGSPVLSIYPNPSDGVFTVNMTANVTEDVTMIITNTVGQKLKEIKAKTNQPTIIVADMPAGIYFINAVTDHENMCAQIVISQ